MILVLSTADTDLLSIQSVAPARALAHGQEELPAAFPPVLTANATHVPTIARLLEELSAAGKSAVVMRLHGGRRACPDSLDLVARTCRERSIPLVVVAADGQHDPDLTASCHLPLPAAGLSDAHTGGARDVTSATGLTISDRISTYFQYGGRRNALHLLRFVADALLGPAFGSEAPAPQPEDGVYHPPLLGDHTSLPAYLDVLSRSAVRPERPRIGVLFYRAHWLSGNLAFIDGLIRAIERAGGEAFPVFCASLRPPARSTPSDDATQPYLLKRYFLDADDQPRVDALISTLSFAASTISTPVGEGAGLASDQEETRGVEAATEATGEAGIWFARLGVPILQALVCSDARAVWTARQSGLNPLDVAMQVALPEFDGRIITVPVSFKEANHLGFSESTGGRQESWPGPLPAGEGTRGVPRYVPDEERCDALARQAVAWGRLRRTPADQRRVAVVLGSYSGKNGRIGNAVGLDTPASLVRVLEALRNAGYIVG
ncbi:MAG TPA: cobaltochelatase subunit CobN, partial [Chloroflexota bacterium]|nr:cobaltochelatase subunit CobN [Chloroflexota bacterium]